MSRSSSITALISSTALPSRIHDFRLDADRFANHLCRFGDDGLGLLTGFGPHDLLDAQPLLKIALGNHVDKHQPAIGILGAPAGIMHSALTFRCAIDHRHEFAAMPFEP